MILTPELERQSGYPEGFLVYTSRYGETKSVLGKDFSEGVRKIEGKYRIDVPKEVINICTEIKALGGRAFLVGGSVRDAIITAEIEGMNLRPKDFDLEIYGIEPRDLVNILGTKFKFDNSKDTVGKKFEVLKVRIDGWEEPLDCSIPRVDSKSGVGHKGFEATAHPSMSIKEAARRRDIKPNSCSYDPLTETVYDPFDGISGILNREIEVTDEETFQEDPLRVSRLMQFLARFEFKVADKTKLLCKVMVERGDLDELSQNRITEEFKKLILKGKSPSLGFRFALETGMVERFWPELFALVGVPQEYTKEFPWHPEGDVWEHSMQVVDAAARIADREKLDKEERMILILAALCHDFGKPNTTAFVDGAIRSRGHEEAGKEPTLDFLSRFANPKEPNSGISPEVRKAVAALVVDHLKPKEMWKSEVKNGDNMDSATRRLSAKLGNNGTSLYLLSLLAEADQRGRNGEANEPLEREKVDELVEWQLWLAEKASALKVIEMAPVKIITGGMVAEIIGGKGPWVGAVMKCVYADQLDGLVESIDVGMEKVKIYFEQLTKRVAIVAEHDEKKARTLWDEIRSADDPRLYLSAI